MKLKRAIFLALMLVVTGCGHYVKWITCAFTGSSTAEITAATVLPFICSKRIYQQFRTVAIFDVLWLSKEVLQARADLYAARRGLGENQIEIIQDDTLSFYVLMSRADFGIPATIDTVYPPWTVTLCINGKSYEPAYLKAVDLEPEYICMLNVCLLKFRRPFLVKFDTALQDLTPATEFIELTIAGVCFKTSCTWRRGCGALCS